MSISSTDNYIDPTEVASEAQDFRDEIESKEEEIEEARDELLCATEIEDDEAEEDAGNKLDSLVFELKDLKEEAESMLKLDSDCDSYAQGSSLINSASFEEYVEDLAAECGDINRDSYLYNYIDWSRVAKDAEMDYTTITFEGQDFFVNA